MICLQKRPRRCIVDMASNITREFQRSNIVKQNVCSFDTNRKVKNAKCKPKTATFLSKVEIQNFVNNKLELHTCTLVAERVPKTQVLGEINLRQVVEQAFSSFFNSPKAFGEF